VQVSASIVLQDLVSPALMSVIQATRQTVLALQQLEGTTESQKAALQSASISISQAEAEINRMASAFRAASGAVGGLSGPERDAARASDELARGAKNAGEEIRRLGDVSGSSGKNIGNMVRDLLAATGGLYILNRAFGAVRSGIQSAIDRGVAFMVNMEQIRTSLNVMIGDVTKANRYLADVLAFAKHTPFQFPDLANLGRNLIAFGMEAENTLPVLNAIGDAVGAIGGGRNELMMIGAAFGDIVSAGQLSMQEVRRLQEHGIPALQIIANQLGKSAQDTMKLISGGAIDANAAIAMLVKGIEEGTDGLAGKTAATGGMMQNIKQTWTGALDTLSTSLRNLGTTAVEGVFPLFKDIILETAATINSLSQTAKPVFEWMAQAGQWIHDNWSVVGPVFFGVATALGILTAATIFHGTILPIVTSAWAAFNAVLRANPIILVISLVASLISILVSLWKTNDNFAAALYRIWNKIVAFFWTVVEGIASAFEWMAQYVGKVFDTLINGIIKGINKVLELVNRVTGSSYKIEAEFSMENVAKGMREYAQIQKELAKQRASDAGVQTFIAGRQAARADDVAPIKTPMPDVSPSLLNPSGFSPNEMIGNIGKVDKVGKIEQPVDISSEDLKIIRELAEINAINNFVTLTPSVSITTGDIRERADVDELIRRIEDYLSRELATTARRVYG